MTKKEEIVWRLKESPTSQSLRELVKDGILTKDEAREILFATQSIETRDITALEKEVKFLRELVEKLSQNRSQIVEVIKEIQVPYKQYPWYNPYIVWCSSGVSGGNVSGGITGYGTSGSFSSIKTF